ncbi:MAG: chorismate synthase, partial [Spirochaetaceae bacterium]|nr:chorismate synthase [Spirochaetaceae bacterium]
IFIEGRHDVCVCPRIVPVVEAMSYLTIADMFLRNKNAHI